MDPDRRAAIIVGVVFIIATVAALGAAPFVPDLKGPDYLTRFAESSTQVGIGALFHLVAAFGSGAIAIIMYPIMRRSHPTLALASVIFRAIEAVFYMVALLCLLSILTLGTRFAQAGDADKLMLQIVADTLRGARQHASLLGVFAFCIGAVSYYWLFFLARLVPRWLSGFGLVAIALMFIACLIALVSDGDITSYVYLVAPIALQEMVLAIWLIAMGFNAPAAARTTG